MFYFSLYIVLKNNPIRNLLIVYPRFPLNDLCNKLIMKYNLMYLDSFLVLFLEVIGLLKKIRSWILLKANS